MRKGGLLAIGLFSIFLLLVTACGGEEETPTPTRGAPTPTPTAAARPTPTPQPPADTPTVAPAAPVTLEVSAAAGEQLKFDKDKLTAKTGAQVVLRFRNTSAVLEHNWVLVKAGNKDAVANDGVAAGPANNWIPAGDARVIANTLLLKPGTTGEAKFTAPAPGTYQFVCTFPGHNVTMFGEFAVTQ